MTLKTVLKIILPQNTSIIICTNILDIEISLAKFDLLKMNLNYIYLQKPKFRHRYEESRQHIRELPHIELHRI